MRALLVLALLSACARTDGTDSWSDAPPETLCTGTDGLVVWYRFNDPDPSAAIQDSSGNDVPASCTACPAPTTGAIGGGLEFSPTEETVVLVTPDDPALLDGSSGFTLAAFVRTNQLPVNPDGTILAKQRGSAMGLSYWVGVYRSNVEVWIEQVRRIMEPVVFDAGEIAHIAVTWSPDQRLHLYQNGVLSGASVGVTPVFDDNAVAIGAWVHPPAVEELWDGMIDDVRIYDRALDAAEVETLLRCAD